MRAIDTIYALSSGSLPAGVAVIRISGPEVRSVVAALCDGLPVARKASLRWIRSRNDEYLDQGLVIFFEAPQSFTGEDCAELQIHGSRASVRAVLQAIGSELGCRLAEPGEFSRRAFENGKLDLVEIEGLSDLIAAETEMQRRLAIEQAGGGLSKLYQSWSDRITRARALIEAELDFSDEDDVPGSVSDQVWEDVERLAVEIGYHLNGEKTAEIIRDGFHVVIAGPPNSGKSSLINYLAKRDIAIVSEIAGTTRDAISVDINLNGYLVRLTDTAGLRETGDVIEMEGIRRAEGMIASADLVLALSESAGWDRYLSDASAARKLKVRTKIDSVPFSPSVDGDLGISVKSGQGIDSLLKRIEQEMNAAMPYQGHLMPARARQSDFLRRCQAELAKARSSEQLSLEIRTEFLRSAAHLLDKITGRTDTEELLGVIFSEFCIGK
jgi:tRNA modification GTPase